MGLSLLVVGVVVEGLVWYVLGVVVWVVNVCWVGWVGVGC